MSITDELREYVNQTPVPKSRTLMEARDRFNAIADHIDEEHERATSEFWAKINAVPATDENMAERGWVKLPKDADGEYIHVGDEIRDGWHGQNQGEVQRLMLDRYGWWLMLKNNSERFYVHDFHEWHHHKPPTVEDVLCELLDKVDDDRAGQAEIIAEYAAKLRLVGDAE